MARSAPPQYSNLQTSPYPLRHFPTILAYTYPRLPSHREVVITHILSFPSQSTSQGFSREYQLRRPNPAFPPPTSQTSHLHQSWDLLYPGVVRGIPAGRREVSRTLGRNSSTGNPTGSTLLQNGPSHIMHLHVNQPDTARRRHTPQMTGNLWRNHLRSSACTSPRKPSLISRPPRPATSSTPSNSTENRHP